MTATEPECACGNCARCWYQRLRAKPGAWTAGEARRGGPAPMQWPVLPPGPDGDNAP